MIPMISKVEHPYDNIQRPAGQEYACHPEHVGLLVGMGWAETREHYETRPDTGGRRLRTKFKQIVAN